ncbi:hypothetical protein LJ737_04140 [Hymenobacter sp. 15J16-1T3B]|uniref:hypothetical protein n=1 Tax=Hymenobacter sp. 15J16-1T3B TaxID=2886941 RepID=UPI001D125ECD|nr:hypothetical protein [Hymenobacter sp. 15J16-1T3B]MCC3156412.1 hypothetical protein [Hymenobacter sp. 15J16-1T3B]
MESNARFVLGAAVHLDPHATNLEIRINDGSCPWVITHDFQRYLREGQDATAAYLAKRYLASRPDQLRYCNLAVVTGLLLVAMEEYETRDACA